MTPFPEDPLEKLARIQRRPDSVALRAHSSSGPTEPETSNETDETDGLSVKIFDDEKHNVWMRALLNR